MAEKGKHDITGDNKRNATENVMLRDVTTDNKRDVSVHDVSENSTRPASKPRKAGRYNWLVSIAVNAVILILMLHFTDLMYETNDDFAIAEKIAAGYPYIGFVSYYLCKLLIYIQEMFTGVNVFVVSQLVMSFAAFTVILKVIMDRSRYLSEMALAAVVIAFFSFDHYSSVQFTKTAALLMTAGLIFVADTYINNRKKPLKFILYTLIAYALYFTGVAYRQKGMFPALGFAGLFMLAWIILNGRTYYRGRKAVPEILLIIVLLAGSLVPYWLDMKSDAANAGTPELKLGRDYQAERVLITDYPMIENYEEHKAEYDGMGLSENDLYLIDRWIFDYDGAASLENMEKINEINYPGVIASRSVTKALKKFLKNTLNAVRELNSTGIHILILLLLAVYFFSAVRPKNWTYVLLSGVMAVCVYAAVFYMARPQYRAFYAADIGAAMWILFALAGIRERNTRYVRRITCIIVICLTGLLFVPALNESRAQMAHNESQIEEAEVTEYFAEHLDSFFVGPTTMMKQPASYLDPLAVPELAPNVSGTGGWETLTPYKLDFLAKYGITNPVKDLIDNPGAYYYGESKKGKLREYYNKWYGSEDTEIRFEKVDEIAGNGIYRVVTSANPER